MLSAHPHPGREGASRSHYHSRASRGRSFVAARVGRARARASRARLRISPNLAQPRPIPPGRIEDPLADASQSRAT